MIVLVFTIIVILLCFNILTFILLKSRLKKMELLFDDQKFQMAEANLKLLEQREQLEEQKYKMAEANVTLLEQKEIIEEERHRSEKLLQNILPVKVADQLKENGKTEPENFEDVTVFFSDLVDFTKTSANLQPKELIEELNDLFTVFDHIMENNHCERIKTIGDAYLCVCGMPEANEQHAENIVKSALEIVRYLKKRNQKAKHKWSIRIGIHTGKVVGGVVGIKKYIYDVFGDTINMASRMESHSEPMRVNISDTTYKLISDKFNCDGRGPLPVKGKGLYRMYYVEDSLNES